MADQSQFDPVRIGGIAQRIAELLADEDPETRRRATQAAFALLGDDFSPALIAAKHFEPAATLFGDEHQLATFFNRQEKCRPADYAYLCAAYHFSTYGTAAFSLDDLRGIAREAGVVLPDRLDMTLKQAGKAGKRLFQTAGRDAYRPTASAGVLFAERWSVKPGKQIKQMPASADR